MRFPRSTTTWSSRTGRRLSDEGYRIRIITHRLTIRYFHRAAVRQIIDYHGIPYWDLCFMKEKDQVGADIYVEDTPENLRRLRRGHYAICFANSTNRDIPAPRAATWRDMYKLIKDREPVAVRSVRLARRNKCAYRAPVLRQTSSAPQVVDSGALIRPPSRLVSTPLLHLLRLLPFLVGGHRQIALENLALRQRFAVLRSQDPLKRLQGSMPTPVAAGAIGPSPGQPATTRDWSFSRR
jgi:5' nucleotidase, deoxy (Pyrimidine), cytosolic type C protein (NT5C)